MPIQSFSYSLVQNVPVIIAPQSHMVQEVHVHNHEHALVRELYVGGSSAVSSTNGHHVIAMSDMVIHLQPDQVLWAMTPTAAGCAVTVLAIRKELDALLY